MTSATVEPEVLRLDIRGRVLVSAERREALLEEFERSGVSGASFARMAGIKYPTFMQWLSRRRQSAGSGSGDRAIRLLEATVEGDAPSACAKSAVGDWGSGDKI